MTDREHLPHPARYDHALDENLSAMISPMLGIPTDGSRTVSVR